MITFDLCMSTFALKIIVFTTIYGQWNLSAVYWWMCWKLSLPENVDWFKDITEYAEKVSHRKTIKHMILG